MQVSEYEGCINLEYAVILITEKFGNSEPCAVISEISKSLLRIYSGKIGGN